ncbi:TraR/DksA family transcriptional regulator [Archangium violaceum]|uniref:TraR/DksA family transcriptional regulator n=1 Tax=Archangium violaceum TaxID=83451 RepID=UPI001950740E|nr:TraR/DksA family transcriptional regulator [Archangium violaceum]QRN98219.1 TraR/DksA family transcriptional regulator [Archangium violaceum]
MNTWTNQAREALLQRRSSLRGLLRDNREEAEELREGRASEQADEAAEESVAEVLERLSERERRELRDIDDALVRIEQGGFGHCARCGGAIGRHRLLAIPEARHCMACSAQVER